MSLLWGWRWAVVVVTAAAAAVTVAARVVLPVMAPAARPGAGKAPALRDRLRHYSHAGMGVLSALTLTVVAGHFISYTFIVVVITDVVGVRGPHLAWLLAAFGVAGLIAMPLIGRPLDRAWLDRRELHRADHLLFEFGPEPSSWGHGRRPPSSSTRRPAPLRGPGPPDGEDHDGRAAHGLGVILQEPVQHHIQVPRMTEVIAMQCRADILADHLLHLLRPLGQVHHVVPQDRRAERRQVLVFGHRRDFLAAEAGHVPDIVQCDHRAVLPTACLETLMIP